MIQLLTIDFRKEDQAWLDDIINCSAPEPHLRNVTVGKYHANHHVLDQIAGLLDGRSSHHLIDHATRDNLQLTVEQINVPVDLIIVANYDDINRELIFIEEVQQRHQLLRDSDILVIDMVATHLHEHHEIMALAAGVIDYWGIPLSTRVMNLRLQRLLSLRWERQQLEKLSAIDALTGVYNRRSMERNMTMEWRRAIRECHGLGIMMIDIDHFKAFNDFYGHVDGDHCLRHVANIIKEQLLRPCDFLSRYGGEEFVAVLPNIRLNGLPIIAERIQSALSQANIAHACNEDGHKLTVSIGLAWCEPNPTIRQETLLRAADKALYEAKAAGRNRTSDVINAVSGAPELLV